MQGIDATFDEVSFDRGRDPRQALLKIVPGAVALAATACVAVWVLHARFAAPDAGLAQSTPLSAPKTQSAANPFGDIIVDPTFLPGAKSTTLNREDSQVASLESAPAASPPAIPLPELTPLEPSASVPLPDSIPLPPKRDVPGIGDAVPPLPPPRPSEFGATPAPAGPEHPLARKTDRTVTPAAPVDNRNIFEKLLGLGQPAGVGQTNAPRVASQTPESRSGKPLFAPFFGFGGASAPSLSGYDRYTAVYDISARTVYLPDGTRLEAHSGYGDKLDDPRYVNERMVGPTPPNVYALEMREGSFHGVQALRLTPVGDGPLFGRAGLLAHPYMLGPNGDSNGCVSFKDYETFLRAYENGQVKKLVVVAKL